MTAEEIAKTLEAHRKWLKSEEGGSRANLSDANLSRANLSDADLSGADLSDADLSRANLSRANLSGADLSRADLSDADLSDANLSRANLSDADLSGADLSDANLSRANLSDANLSRADLSDANIPQIPIIPDLDRRMAEACAAPGALYMGTWHNSCGTTHCRGGWAITLGGDAGKQLEAAVGPSAAGALIYCLSTPDHYIPDFYASHEDAMADILARAKGAA